MDPQHGILGLLLLLLVVGAIIYSRLSPNIVEEAIMVEDPDKPCLWLYYDTSQVNSRLWTDFGARSSRALNMPYLNLCYETILKNASNYNVRVLKGVESVAEVLGGWEKLPDDMRNAYTVLSPRQKAWIRNEVLAAKGGLWIDPSVVVMNTIPVPDYNTVFGVSDDIMTATPAALREGKPYAIYKIQGNDDASQYDNRVLQRKPDGRRIEIEDLLGSLLPEEPEKAGADYIFRSPEPFEIPVGTIFIPVPWDEINKLRKAGWFLRMSEEQVLKAPLMISKILHKALGY
jgi:hypothetical protein